MLQQVVERAVLRIKDGRARAIDLLALNSPEAPGDFRFQDSLENLFGSFEEEQEFTNLTNDIENIHSWETSEFWRNLKVLSDGYQKYHKATGDIKNLVEQKNKEQVGGMLEKVQNNRDLVTGSDPEYWNLCEFLLRYRRALLFLEPSFNLKNINQEKNDIKWIRVEEYIKWRESEKFKHDSKLIKEGFDNSSKAISFQKTMEKTYLFPLQSRLYHTLVNPEDEFAQPVIPRYFAVEYKAIPWTKHNRLFYDKGTPPDPVTIGYRIDLFYSQTESQCLLKPTYQVKEIDYNWATLTFSFGPMYRDVSFRISNLTWDMLHRGNGFLCKYEDDVLSLRFWFKERKHLSTKFTE